MRPVMAVWRLFQSRTLALILLLIIFAAVLLASGVPQQGKLAYASWQAANPQLAGIVKLLLLDRVYQAWWFYLAVGLLMTNTFVCTIGRIPPLLRQRQRWYHLEEDQIKGLKNWAAVETARPGREVAALLHHRLRQRGYRTAGKAGVGKSFIFARKGELAQWGSLLFHFGFLVLVVGVIVAQFTRYVGTMIITEGQIVTEQNHTSPEQS